jgi:hypothetical protein
VTGRNGAIDVDELVRRAHELDPEPVEFDLVAGLSDVLRRADRPEEVDSGLFVAPHGIVAGKGATSRAVTGCRSPARPDALSGFARRFRERHVGKVLAAQGLIVAGALGASMTLGAGQFATVASPPVLSQSEAPAFPARQSLVSPVRRLDPDAGSLATVRPELLGYDRTTSRWEVHVDVDPAWHPSKRSNAMWLLVDPQVGSDSEPFVAYRYIRAGSFDTIVVVPRVLGSSERVAFPNARFSLIQTYTAQQDTEMQQAMARETTPAPYEDTVLIDQVICGRHEGCAATR